MKHPSEEHRERIEKGFEVRLDGEDYWEMNRPRLVIAFRAVYATVIAQLTALNIFLNQ